MEKKIIDLEVKDNLEPTIKNLKLLKNQLKETAAGSKEFDKLSAQIRDLDDSIADAKATNDDFLGQLENASGPLGMLGQSIRGAERTFSSFNGALKASVIGLIVALIGGLVAAFNENEVAMKKLQPLLDGMQKIFQGIFRAVEPLFNTLVDLAINALPMVSSAFQVVYSSVTAVFQSLGSLGSALLKLMKGDFKGAWSDAKASVNDFSSNYDKSVKRFSAGTKEMTKNEKEEADKRAEERKKAQEKREAAEEKEKEKRIKAAEEEKKRLEELEKERQELIGRQGAKARDEYEASEKLIKDAKKANEDALKTENQIKVEKENADFELKKQDLISKGLSIEEIEAEHKRKLAGLDDEYYANESVKSIKRDADEKLASEAKRKLIELEKKEKLDAADAVSNTLSAMSELLGKETAAGKAAAVASATINTFSSAQKAYDATVGIPFVGPALAPINAGLAIVAGIKNVKSILAVKTPKGGGGGSAPSIGGMSGGSAASVAPSFNVVGASPTNQLAQTIGNKEQQPIKAYVVSADVSTAQSLDRNIISSASLG